MAWGLNGGGSWWSLRSFGRLGTTGCERGPGRVSSNRPGPPSQRSTQRECFANRVPVTTVRAVHRSGVGENWNRSGDKHWQQTASSRGLAGRIC
jgi:hypothetical protein